METFSKLFERQDFAFYLSYLVVLGLTFLSYVLSLCGVSYASIIRLRFAARNNRRWQDSFKKERWGLSWPGWSLTLLAILVGCAVSLIYHLSILVTQRVNSDVS